MTYDTREAYLHAAADQLGVRVFSKAGYDIPPIDVSVGFPSTKALGAKSRALGECWKREASADGKNQIFLSPLIEDPVKAIDILAHELVHAVDDCEHAHRAAFVKICDKVGLTEGPAKGRAAGQELILVIEHIIKDLGEFPHSPLHAVGKDKTQTTRMRKVVCPECGYLVRSTLAWLKRGMPTCPCGTLMVPTEPLPEDPAEEPKPEGE